MPGNILMVRLTVHSCVGVKHGGTHCTVRVTEAGGMDREADIVQNFDGPQSL